VTLQNGAPLGNSLLATENSFSAESVGCVGCSKHLLYPKLGNQLTGLPEDRSRAPFYRMALYKPPVRWRIAYNKGPLGYGDGRCMEVPFHFAHCGWLLISRLLLMPIKMCKEQGVGRAKELLKYMSRGCGLSSGICTDHRKSTGAVTVRCEACCA